MNFIVVGSSAGLGRCLADRLAQNGHNLLLVASKQEDLHAQAADLTIRYSVKVESVALRVQCNKESVDAVKTASARLGQIDGIYFPMGYSRSDDDGTLSADDIERISSSNLSGIMAITAAFLDEFLKRGSGVFAFFGSVAAERGRSSNIAYAAAKRGLLSFYESIKHRCAASKIGVQFYQLGYLNTAQTYGKKLPFPAAQPEDAANYVVSRMNASSGFAYYPGFWRFICLALRCTPWFIFKKLKF